MKQIMKKKKVWMIGAAVLVVILFLTVVISGKIKKVDIVGNTYYTDKEIKEKLMDSAVTRNMYGLYAKYGAGVNPGIPFIEKVSVEISGSHAVTILVSEKPIIGCIKYMSQYLYFDKEGVVVESSPEYQKGIPVIEGVKFTKMTLHEPLQVADAGIFEEIMSVSQSLEKYEIATDKVVFDMDRKVTLYVGDIRVKLGHRKTYDIQIAEISNAIKEAQKKKLKGDFDMENYVEGQGQILFKQTEE